jgi:hypothetical protein
MTAHAIVEVEVRPAAGCTIHHVTDDEWSVYRNDGMAARDITVDDVAWVLDNPIEAAAGARGYGKLWIIESVIGLRLAVVMNE